MAKNVFSVSGMRCNNCKAHVEAALKEVTGVSVAEASLEDANVTVEYDETMVTPAQLKDAVDNAGRYEMNL